MNIALVHRRLDLKGGTEKDLYRTAEGLRDLGHEIHLFCGEYGIAAPSGTFQHKISTLPFGRTARLWKFALQSRKVIRQHRHDVVFSFGRVLGADVLRSGGGSHLGFLERLGREGGAMRRLWQNLSIYHRSVLAIEKLQMRPGRCKRIVAVSEEVKRDLMRHYAIEREKIIVLYNGVDLERFKPRRKENYRRALRERWRIPLDAKVVLFVGSGFRRKGLDRMLPLWCMQEFKDTYLIIAGEDARMRWYQSQAGKSGGRRIIFAGHQRDIENFYAAADVLALPSVQEAFGNVVLEALASGLQVLVSAETGAGEILRGGLAEGVLRRSDDLYELKQRLANLLARSGDASVIAEARRLSESYSWREHFRKLEAVLMEVKDSTRSEERA